MTDTHAVDTTPPPSAPPPQTEVPVTPPSGSPQTPLGSQAPPKPEGQESNKSSGVSRREAIQNAFNRAAKDQEEAAKKPSATRASAERPEKKAAEDTQPTRQPQHREGGRFARDPSKPPPEPTQQQPGQQQPQALDPNARFRDAPPRFSEQARQEWAGAPESVRGAVHQMAREFQGAYEKYRGDYEVMETLRPYHNLAQKQGTTLQRAFDNYYQMEQKLRSDVVGGLDVIVQNLRMTHPDGNPVTLRDVAYHIMNMSPEQHRLTAQQNQQTASDMRIGQLSEMVGKLTQSIGQMQYRQQFTAQRAQVDEFAKTHPRLDELGATIKEELDRGYSLEVAYRRAELLHPSTQAAQTRNTSAQTRRTSISGAPDSNGKLVSTRPSDGQRKPNGEDKHPTRREAIAKAMRRVSNGI